jgi:hypothetical protein
MSGELEHQPALWGEANASQCGTASIGSPLSVSSFKFSPKPLVQMHDVVRKVTSITFGSQATHQFRNSNSKSIG